MRNILDLHDQMLTLFADIKSGTVEVKVASEMNNTVGKIIGLTRLQLSYAELRKESPAIPFLDGNNKE